MRLFLGQAAFLVLVDLRDMRREVQEIAYAKGMISPNPAGAG